MRYRPVCQQSPIHITTIAGIARTAPSSDSPAERHVESARPSRDRTLLSRAGFARAPATMLIGPMNVQMPPAEAAGLELSARALKPHAAVPAAEMVLPPGIDQEVLDFARQMFVGGPGWPQLPPRRSFALDPSNLQLFVAAVVVDFLFRHEKARFTVIVAH